MMFSIEQKIRVPFFLSLVCLLGIGGLGYWSAQRSISMYRVVDQTHEVLDVLENTWIGILNAETSAQGYVSSGDEALLKPYESGMATITNGCQRLRQLTLDNAEQHRNLEALETLLTKKLGGLDAIVRERQAPGAATSKAASPREGEKLMDEIRHSFATMETVERRLLAENSATAQSKAR